MRQTDKREQEQERYLETTRKNAHSLGGLQANRQVLLDAGFSPTLIKRAIQAVSKALDAEKIRVKMSNGACVGSVKSPDWDNRLKAAGLIFGLSGLSKQEDSKLATVNVQVINFGKPSSAT